FVTSRPLFPPLSSFYSFSLYCYADHRDLHSFPTRRSSDLPFQRGKHRVADGDLALLVAFAHRAEPPVAIMVALEVAHARRPARRDRKSTRLNSSHVKISYAVFCLKKKKKRQ